MQCVCVCGRGGRDGVQPISRPLVTLFLAYSRYHGALSEGLSHVAGIFTSKRPIVGLVPGCVISVWIIAC
jgi:hypothetical protein